MSKHVENKNESGGIAQFFVEHREVSWLALIAVLVWGGLAYTKLGQQEDPTIPQRTAMLVTQFPGATASKVEELVSKPLERKISELNSIEEIKTTSRPGISTMTIKQLPGSDGDDRSAVGQGARQDFGGAVARGNASAVAQHGFRQHHHAVVLGWSARRSRTRNASRARSCCARSSPKLRERRAVHAIARRSPHSCPALSPQYREVLTGRLETALRAAGLAKEVRTAQGQFVHSGGPGDVRQPRRPRTLHR